VRTLDTALSAALARPGAVPDLRLELADSRPRFADAGGGAAGGPTASLIGPDGSVISAYVGTSLPQTVYAQRVTDPASPTQWSAWTAISADGRAQAGPALCTAGGTTRLLWQAAASTAIYYVDSLDSGLTWSGPAVLFDPAAPCYGLAADGDLGLVLVAYDALGLGSVRLAVWRLAGIWSHTDWTNGDQTTIVGISAVQAGPGAYAVILALQGATGEAYSIQSASVTTSGTPAWTNLAPVIPVDTSAGLIVCFPHLGYFDGAYRLAYRIADTGVVSGLVYARVARSQSQDFVHWQAPLEDAATFPSGAVWLRHADCTLLVSPEMVRRAPLYDPTTDYRDLTADITRLELREREGEPARLTVTLDNSTGFYSGLSTLVPNGQLLLSRGFVGAGLLPTHLLYIDQWTYRRAADLNEVTIAAQDRLRFLTRSTRIPLSYTGRSVAYILSDLAALAGFEQPAAIEAASQFSEIPALFQVQAGHAYLSAVTRLLAAYVGAIRARVLPGTGPAFAAVDMPTVIGKDPGDPVVWTTPTPGSGTPDDVVRLYLTHGGDRANHLILYGPQHAPSALADAWDFADVAAVGQERYAPIVEGFAVTSATASLLAGLALAGEQRLALGATAVIGAHPGLELGDVIAIHDQWAPTLKVRIVALTHSYQALSSLHELVLGCEGVE
jgi:hypothetical protein